MGEGFGDGEPSLRVVDVAELVHEAGDLAAVEEEVEVLALLVGEGEGRAGDLARLDGARVGRGLALLEGDDEADRRRAVGGRDDLAGHDAARSPERDDGVGDGRGQLDRRGDGRVDAVDVAGVADLDGALAIELINGFVRQPGDTF